MFFTQVPDVIVDLLTWTELGFLKQLCQMLDLSDQAILLQHPAPEIFSAFSLSILFSCTQTYVLPLCTAYYTFLEGPSVLYLLKAACI